MSDTSFRVTEGQRYAQRLSMRQRTMVWKVGSILSNTVPIPHARLINVHDPLRTKTISCTTLVDRVYYQPVSENSTRDRLSAHRLRQYDPIPADV